MSNGNFLVTGLPRSRTAWMSAFLSTENSICQHEPTAFMNSVDDIVKFYKAWPHKFVGASDSGMGMWIDWVLGIIKPKTLIIERSLTDVEQSLEDMKLPVPATNYCDLLLGKLLTVKNHPLVLWVPFDALNEQRVMQKIWWHLLPGEPFDEQRYRRMCNLNITVNLSSIPMRSAGIMKDILPMIKIK